MINSQSYLLSQWMNLVQQEIFRKTLKPNQFYFSGTWEQCHLVNNKSISIKSSDLIGSNTALFNQYDDLEVFYLSCDVNKKIILKKIKSNLYNIVNIEKYERDTK